MLRRADSFQSEYVQIYKILISRKVIIRHSNDDGEEASLSESKPLTAETDLVEHQSKRKVPDKIDNGLEGQ